MFTALLVLLGLAVAGTVASATVAGVTGKRQVDAQTEMNDKQIQANKELNESNIAEAEKAYQRSTASNQMREYLKAGLSEQQARAIIAAGGAPASYTPANLVSSMDGTSADGIVNGLGTIGSGISGGIGDITNMATSLATNAMLPDGGFLGAALTEEIQSTVLAHIDSLPDSARSFSGFMSFAKSALAPSWASNLVDSPRWHKALASVPGNRALNTFFSQMNDYATGDAKLQGVYLNNQHEAIKIALSKEELTQEEINAARASIAWGYDKPNMALFSQEKYMAARNNVLRLTSDHDFLSDPQYRDKMLLKQMTDLDSQVMYATVLKAIYSGEADWLNADPANAALIGIYSAFGKAGITQTEAGVILASLEASGIPLTASVKQLSNAVRSGLPSTTELVDFGKQIVEEIDETITEGSEKAKKIMQPVGEILEKFAGSTQEWYVDLSRRYNEIWNSDLPYYKKVYLTGKLKIR